MTNIEWNQITNRFLRRLPARAGFLLGNLPLSLFTFTVLITLFSLSVGMAIIYVGVLLAPVTLLTARYLGDVWCRWVGSAEGQEIVAPFNPPFKENGSYFRRLFAPLSSASDWKALLHGLFSLALTLVTWTVAVVWISMSLGGLTYWLWGLTLSNVESTITLPDLLFGRFFGGHTTYLFDSISYFLLGVIFTLTLPLVYAALTRVHWIVADLLLGVSEQAYLRQKVDYLSASRLAALNAEGRTLSNLERDLHDGPQQHLVRLQMDLDSVGRRIKTDPAAASTLVAEARQTANDALEEIRAISRGFAPPILEEKGLEAALISLGTGSPISTLVEVDYSSALPEQIERTLYYASSELLTNINKHSQATKAQIHLFAGYSNDGQQKRVILQVSDNGVGGATVESEGGLGGLRQCLQGVDGSLEIISAENGPTLIRVVIPVPATMTL